MDKDLAVLKETSSLKLDSQDKRLADIGLTTAQHANHLAAVANQTTAVGNYISYTSILITILVLGAGFITYFSAKSKAESEARDAAEKWFNQRSIQLNADIEQLRTKVETASAQIDSHQADIASRAATASASIDEASRTVLQASKVASPESTDQTINEQAARVVRAASEALKTKAESSFTADDYYARGLDYFSNKNYQSALAAFEKAIELSFADVPSQRVAQFYFAKGVSQGQLDKPLDAIATYDAIDQRFGNDTAPAVRGQVANGLNGAGFARVMLGKQSWLDTKIRNDFLDAAITVLTRGLQLSASTETRVMLLGNLGYCQFLRGNSGLATTLTTECLKLGGKPSLEAQCADAKLHRIEPNDVEYEALLLKIWNELHP